MGLKETYNKIAEDWHEDHQTDDWWVRGTDEFIKLLNYGSLVLDVGCGGGTKSKYLISKGLRVIGIDVSDNMVKIAKREVLDGKFITMDLADISKLSDNFEGIFMQAVLLHIPKKDVPDTLKSLVSKLKIGGYIYIAVKEKRLNGVEEEVKVDDDYGYSYERFFSYFTIEELEDYLEKLSLETVFTERNPPSRSGRASNWISIIGKKV